MAVDVFARTLALASLGNGGGGSAVDTYTKAEINKMIGDLETIQVELVDELPYGEAKNNVIYFKPATDGNYDGNYYEEWMYFGFDEPESGGFWEQIGTTEIDMSQYSTTEELQEMMLQELAKYITNADFTEALKDYATKKYVDDTVGAIEIPSIEGLATEEYVNEKIEEIAFTPNWNAREGEEGYIENRTHYSNFTTNEVIYHPNSASFGLAAGNNGTYWFVHEINDVDTIAKISAADKISINFLGTVVEGLEKKSKIVEEVEGQPQEGELITVYWFGNDYAFSAFSPLEGMQDTGEPVSILVDTSAILLCLRGTADDKGKTMFGTCVIEAVTESVKKLDNKYLDLDAYSTKEYVDAAIAASSSNVEVFEGTQEEYDALSDEEKAKYTIAVIDDGEEV